MNEQVQDKLASILEFLQTSIETGANFAADQAPLVVQEVLLWGFWFNFLLLVSLLLGAAICFVAAYRLRRMVSDYSLYSECPQELEEVWFFGKWGFPAAGFTVLLVFAPMPLAKMVKIWVAPRLYLLDYIKGIIQ